MVARLLSKNKASMVPWYITMPFQAMGIMKRYSSLHQVYGKLQYYQIRMIQSNWLVELGSLVADIILFLIES
jgi:hypothetical protein